MSGTEGNSPGQRAVKRVCLCVTVQILHSHEDAVSLLHRLKSHLFHNVVEVGGRYFVQTQGIAQGSTVSTLLCNIYYGKMEAQYMTVHEDTELLIRQV